MGVETRLRWPEGQEGGQEVRRQQAGKKLMFDTCLGIF